MTDHKFEEEKVKKALRCCAQPDPICKECPYYDPYLKYPCADQLKWAALNLIDLKEAKIESLQAVHADMTESLRLAAEANKDMQVEIEGLKTENKLLIENDVRNKYPNCVSAEKGRIYTRTLEDYDELIGDISAEAIKEFAERLTSELNCIPQHHFTLAAVLFDLDKLVKEMTEENK